MKKTALLIACAGLILGGMSLAAPEKASAGIRVSFGRSYGGGYGYSNFRSRNYGYRNYGYSNFGYNNCRPGYGGIGGGWGGGYGRGGAYGHGHYDYHPTTVVPHGNHLDVIPGHYDYHHTGHGHH